MFHGDDERVDVESLRLSTEMWEALGQRPARGLTGDDPRGVLRLRRRGPVEPVRGVQPLRGATTACRATSSARSTPPTPTRTPGPASSAARWPSTSSATCSRPSAARRATRSPPAQIAAAARRRDPPRDGRGRAPLPRAPGHRLPHEQLGRVRRRRRPPTAPRRPRRGARRCSTTSSSRAGSGVRKPDPRFYEMACELAGVDARRRSCSSTTSASTSSPPKAMGMTTIKVGDPDQALADLEAVVGFPLG